MLSIPDTARSYYENREKLIYSYRGNTFLQGGELYDVTNGRGRIDCSTLVHLVLQGIRYEDSPFVTGDTGAFFSMPCKWYGDGSLSVAQLFDRKSDRTEDIRRSYGLARYIRESGLEIAERNPGPGDLVFFRAGESVVEEYRKYGAYLAIAHVGIVAEDTEYMIHASGRSDHRYNAGAMPMEYVKISERGIPVITGNVVREAF